MALNPQYEDIGKGFVAQYYALFDDPNQRPNLVHLFNVSMIIGRHLSVCVVKVHFGHVMLVQEKFEK